MVNERAQYANLHGPLVDRKGLSIRVSDHLSCPNCGAAVWPRLSTCCDVQCRVELHRWRKSRKRPMPTREGQWVTVGAKSIVSTIGMMSIVRPKAVWVGNDMAPAYSKGAGRIEERVEMKPRPVRHLVNHNDRPEVKEPTPINRGKHNILTGGSGEHKAKRIHSWRKKRAKQTAEILFGFGKHKRSNTVLTTTPM
jgi:predicted nucleic acid-binding Zn ribbon protein